MVHLYVFFGSEASNDSCGMSYSRSVHDIFLIFIWTTETWVFQIEAKVGKIGKIFCLKIGQNFFLLSKVGMWNKLYVIKIFHLILKKFCTFNDFTFKSEVL